jgi:tripartite-type tricarboxylate transporter receptor subunit TctC
MPNNALVISPHVAKDAGFTPADFAPISMVSLQPMVMVTNPSVPAQTVRQLIDYAKANPNKIEYASTGAASFGHLAAEFFMRQAGVQMTHIPYKGQGPVTQALLTGEVKLQISTTSAQMNQFVREGKLRMLGVASLQPSPLAPGVEPIASTLPGYQAEVWFGLLAPAGTPRDVVRRLNDAVVKVLQMPDVKAKFELSGAATVPTTPEQFAARMAEEGANWARIVKESNIKAD